MRLSRAALCAAACAALLAGAHVRAELTEAEKTGAGAGPKPPDVRPDGTWTRGTGVNSGGSGDATKRTLQQLKELDKHSYGWLDVLGAPRSYEFFRATFGSLLPCGDFPLTMPPPDNFELCSPLQRGGPYEGAIVTSLRGNCTYVVKAWNALAGGAAGLVVSNNVDGLLRPPAGPQDARNISFPVVMVNSFAGDLLHHAFEMGAAGVRASFRPDKGACVPSGMPSPEDAAAVVGVEGTSTLPASALRPQGGDGSEGEGEGDAAGEEEVVSTSPKLVVALGTLNVRPAPPASAEDAAATAADGVPRGNGFEFSFSQFGGIVSPSFDKPAVLAKPIHACHGELQNAEAEVEDKWVVVERGVCPMVAKAREAQDAGAGGLIIVNTVGEGPVNALGDDSWGDIYIPVISISAATYGKIKGLLLGPAPAKFSATPGVAGEGMWEELNNLAHYSPAEWSKAVNNMSPVGSAPAAEADAGAAGSAPKVAPAADPAEVRAILQGMVGRHHHASPSGHWERWDLLRRIASDAGYGDVLESVAGQFEAEAARGAAAAAAQKLGQLSAAAAGAGGGAGASGGGGAGLGSALGSGVLPIVTRGMPHTVLDNVDGAVHDAGALLRCTKLGASTFQLDFQRYDASSSYAMFRQLGDALKVQACLETLALRNAEEIGKRIAALRKATADDRTGPRGFERTLQQAFKSQLFKHDAAARTAIAEGAEAIAGASALRRSLPPTTLVSDWLAQATAGGAGGAGAGAPTEGADGEWQV